MKLAVLGTSGKTAREVIIQALERGYEVIAIDNRISKAKDELDYKNLEVITTFLPRIFIDLYPILRTLFTNNLQMIINRLKNK